MNKNILPYVYKLVHKNSGQYYFGYRSANKIKAEKDIGFHYFTSSKTIKDLGFENFEVFILAEFFDKRDAFEFETQLIEQHLSDPLNLNKAVKGKLYPSRKVTTKEHRENLSRALTGKKLSPETIDKIKNTRKITISQMSDDERKSKWGEAGKKAQKTISQMSNEERKLKFGTMRGRTHSAEVRKSISISNTGKSRSEEARRKMSITKKGKKQSPSAIANRTKNFGGGGNPRAIPITVNGTEYSCKKDARIALGWSKKRLNEYLRSPN